MSSEHIPDLNKERTERINKITRIIDEVGNDYLGSFHHDFIIVWLKKDSLHEFEFCAGGFDYKQDEKVEADTALFNLMIEDVLLQNFLTTNLYVASTELK